jgi:hypothetical protein
MNRPTRIPLFVVALMMLSTCTSRYKMELFQTADEIRHKIKVESTKYIPGRILGDPNSVEKFVVGNGNTMVLTTGTRGTTREAEPYAVFRFDEYLRSDIYFQLGEPILIDTLRLVDNSYLWIKGRYDQPASSRLFMPDSGYLSIDSILSGRLYATLRGTYRNAENVPLSFDGQFRVKIRE